MKSAIFLVTFMVFGYCAGSDDRDVLILTDSNFDDKIKEHDVLLIEFYAPWCGHCKKLEPEYNTAATALLKRDPPIRIAKVDCIEAGKTTCSKQKVTGFPTMKVFRDGGNTITDYNGPRNSAGIVSFMAKQGGPASTLMTDAERVNKLAKLAPNEGFVLAYFEKNSDLDVQYKKVASALLEDYKFVHVEDKAVADELKLVSGSVNVVRAFNMKNKFEKDTVALIPLKEDSGVKLESSIITFIKDNMFGLCGLRTPDNQEQFKFPLVVALYDVNYERNIKGTNYWRNRLMKAIGQVKDVESAVTGAVSSFSSFQREAADLGITSPTDKPSVVVFTKEKSGKLNRFVMKAEFSVDNVASFATSVLQGKEEPYLKSEEIPTADDGNVKIAVAKNFETLVNDPTKDVLIEFYAPWCGHCKSLEPKYKQLADKLADTGSVIIAKMDATANDVPAQYEVSGFPTIYWAPKGSKDKPKKYSGGREVDEMLAFIKAEASEEISVKSEL